MVTESDGPSTIITAVATLYIGICPTGFTTITTTYTTTYCPEMELAPASLPTAPSLPTDWSMVVTVCTHCAPASTAVTLTLSSTAPETVDEP